jgi:undecaprenyl-diphosphatase
VSVAGGLHAKKRSDAASFARGFFGNVAWGFATILRPPRLSKEPKWRASSAPLVFAAMIAIAVIAAAMMLFDAEAAQAARGAPRWIVLTFGKITDFGLSGWFLWPCGIGLAAIAAVATRDLTHFSRLVLAVLAVRLSFLFTAIALPGTVVTIGKRLIGRARPYVGGNLDPFLYLHPVWRPDYASLPSGHATTAFAAMVAIASIWPHLGVPMLVYAVLIAASRVILTAHYLSDVIAGAVIGAVGALLVRDWFATRRLGFVIEPNGSVHSLPWPPAADLKRVARRLAGF